MNIIENSFNQKKPNKSKIVSRVILTTIILLILVIIGIVIAMVMIEKSAFRVYLDGSENAKIKDMLIFEEDGTVYVPIRDIASFLGYQSYSGDYSEKSEDRSKCYIQSEDEVANFTLNSNKIYKISSESNSNYNYFYAKRPVKAINGNLYVSSDGIEKAFNIIFNYDKDKNQVAIYTLPYLIQYYTPKVLDYNYAEIQDDFNNYKAVLESKLIVNKNNDKKGYGVINCDTGAVIIEPKYDSIKYLENTGDFLVSSNQRVGIISKTGEMKIQLLYDSLDLMDSDAGLYLAKRENKYGVIDTRGNTKIYIENDEIGIDSNKFAKNDIKNNYILGGKLIPVRKDKYWGFFDFTGKQVVDFKYDSLGYVATSNKDALNLLVIPDYNVIVVCKDKKYTIINTSGTEIYPIRINDIYMTIESGKKFYYAIFGDSKFNVTGDLDRLGVKVTQKSNESNQSEDTNTTNQNANGITNTINQNTSNQQEDQNNSQENE